MALLPSNGRYLVASLSTSVARRFDAIEQTREGWLMLLYDMWCQRSEGDIVVTTWQQSAASRYTTEVPI